jgi:CTP synthase
LAQKGKYDIVITEIGGTVGDIESLPYIESVRQLKWELGSKALVIHLTLVPYLAATGELKTKPTQHSVKQLLEEGVQPDILVLRTEYNIDLSVREKGSFVLQRGHRSRCSINKCSNNLRSSAKNAGRKTGYYSFEKVGLPINDRY